MKYCDTCGCKISDAHPFTICPQCLFGAALNAERPAKTPGSSHPAETERSPPAFVPRLFARPDFFLKYDLLEPVAQGGQGEVWKVWDFELRRNLAMKRLSNNACASEPAVYRFLAEAQIASQLEHPGILPIFDAGIDPDGRPFYTTQLLPGTTLADIWDRVHKPGQKEWTTLRAIELVVRVCEVMAHAHSRGVIHRDLKPTNILVGAFGDVRVIDWGSAHVLEEAKGKIEETFVPLNRETVETVRGQAMWAEPGSPLATANAGQPVTVLFMPPEILLGQIRNPDPTTDIYSMGVMLYELLTGRPPYSKADGSLPDSHTLRELISSGSATPVRSVNPGVSRDQAAVCQKAMAYNKSERYQFMSELADDLRAVLEVRPVRARRPGPVLKLQKWAQRNLAYVMLAGLILVIMAVGFAITRGLRVERDAARQITALRNAELAARSGHWREALQHWDDAEAAGYNDSIHLALQRAEARTVLNEPVRAEALLVKLARRSDLGGQRGVVLLRLGEHELFGRTTSDQGVRHVREALSAGLAGADEIFAKGLLADSTPGALELFRDALRLNPYHHGAHRHSLGLEFLLGRHQELAEHIRIFKVLYPDDPTPGFLEAAELALQGRVADMEAHLKSLRDATNPELWQELNWGFHALADAVKYYDVENFLKSRGTNDAPLGLFAANPSSAIARGNRSNGSQFGLRLPQLPCVRDGVLEGNDAVRSLMIPYLSDPGSAVGRIKSSWRHHPEALVPLMAGILLEQRQPRDGTKLVPLLQIQADLFQLAAESSSVIPKMPSLARYLAAKAEFELVGVTSTNSETARLSCLKQIQRAVESRENSIAEARAYFDFAFALKDYGLARNLLDQWQSHHPEDDTLLRDRIQLEVSTGAFGNALTLIDEWLVKHPDDNWAKTQRKFAIGRLAELLERANKSSISKE